MAVIRILRKPKLIITICVCFTVLILYSTVLYKQPKFTVWTEGDIIHSSLALNKPGGDEELSKEIVILRYTKYFGHLENAPVLNPTTDCSYIKHFTNFSLFNSTCRITFDRSFSNQSDALVFHSADLEMNNDLPLRNTEQLWVYLQQESPPNTGLNLKKYSDVFNWTMTYRRDSDVYHPYAYIFPKTIKTPKINFNKKTGQVAWIVSNCNPASKRSYFVYELQKYISVDIYGDCGDKCPTKDCYSYVASKYKFYLAFENTLCTDYITEKFFYSLMHDIVPVVYGGNGAIDYTAIAPKNSFIDSQSFDSPKNLAAYLLYLDTNEEEYLKYFGWKEKYEVFRDITAWCNLCQKLHEHKYEKPRKVKWYKDLWKWWNFKTTSNTTATTACTTPPKKLTNFYHSIFKVGIGGQIVNWMRHKIKE